MCRLKLLEVVSIFDKQNILFIELYINTVFVKKKYYRVSCVGLGFAVFLRERQSIFVQQ